MKDLKMLAGVLGILVIVVPASWGVFAKSWEHQDTATHLAELSKEFRTDQLERQQTNVQQRIWFLEDRLEERPSDKETRRKLQEAEEEKKALQIKLEKLKE